ncbi:MAG: ABC transporter permease [Thermomicrobiales bacterium]
MWSYILSRLLEAAVTIWGVITIVFFSLRLTGDPVLLLVPMGTPPEQIEQLRHALGFDRPLLVQYFSFWSRVMRGDFGDSLRFGESSLPLVIERLPATAQLALTAMVVAIVLGGVAGAVAAVRPGSVFELVAMTGALIGQATPVFWLGIMLVLIFAAELRWLPSGGRGGPSHLVLPVFTLALFSSASIARLLRSSLLEVRGQDYVRTARAKGLPERTVFFGHQLKGALIPVVTVVGVQTGRLLGGAVITETIFSWPGVGRLIVQAIENRDFPLVQASATVLAVTIVGVNLIVDLTYAMLDPRIRLGRSN